ncbi:MAG: hypothetical protein WCV62_04905 [Candidatus Peribacteraceae bacterium]
MRRTPLLTALGFTAVLLALAVADAVITSPALPSSLPANLQPPVASGQGVPKQTGPSVEQILSSLRMETATARETGLIARIVPEPQNVKSAVLLREEDRLAWASWIESPDVKTYFNAIKEALHASFSPGMTELKDETFSAPQKPVVNFLTFRDPAIAPERIVFLRVRERLFEFHVAEGKDADIAALLTELSK